MQKPIPTKPPGNVWTWLVWEARQPTIFFIFVAHRTEWIRAHLKDKLTLIGEWEIMKFLRPFKAYTKLRNWGKTLTFDIRELAEFFISAILASALYFLERSSTLVLISCLGVFKAPSSLMEMSAWRCVSQTLNSFLSIFFETTGFCWMRQQKFHAASSYTVIATTIFNME